MSAGQPIYEGDAFMPQSQHDPTAFEMTDRGFKHFTPIATDYGHVVRVYESSAAESPHLWLAIDATDSALRGDKGIQTAAHLSLEQAEALRDSLTVAIATHYQR